MRAGCRLSTIALCLGVAFAGCTSQHGTASSTHHAMPAPTDPDLGAVLERYYQQIEGRHWDVAYAMLSPRLRAALPEPAFEARYAPFTDADVNVGESNGMRVQVDLDDTANHIRATENLTLKWNGEDWTIDRIDRAGQPR